MIRCQVRITHGHGDRALPKNFLQNKDVATILDKMTGKRMAQNMRQLAAWQLKTTAMNGCTKSNHAWREYPQRGTRVMLMFAYGSPNKPCITAIYPHGGALPKVAEGELLLQQREGVQQRIDAAGNTLRQTDGKIADECQDHTLDALTSTVTLQKEDITVTGNSTRTVKGAWVNRVLGAGCCSHFGRRHIEHFQRREYVAHVCNGSKYQRGAQHGASRERKSQSCSTRVRADTDGNCKN